MTGRLRSVGAIAFAIVACVGHRARSDEGGVSFWLPGQYGSFAAIAPSPGWSLPMMYYNYGGSGGAVRELRNDMTLAAGLNSSFNGLFLIPTYTPDTTILGARPSFSLAFAAAQSSTTADLGVGAQGARRTDSVWGGSDFYPTAQLYWNAGVNNFMSYVTGSIPVGSYSADRLANIGIGHAAIDVGGAYTYLDTKSGTEFSVTAGVTYNFRNPSTNYTNGIDFHVDLGAAQFLTERLFIGAVGYYYQQLTSDRGQAPALGSNESRTRGIGPQIGYNFDVGGTQIYTNLRGYTEFGAYRRLQGHSIYFTVGVPLSGLFR